MDVGLLFWFLMILAGISLIGGFTAWRDSPFLIGFGSVVQWILFALLGWRIFGPIIH
jgi:hypothetical protein